MEQLVINKMIIAEIRQYYDDKLLAHGASYKGVDWNSKKSQILRYEILSKVINNKSFFSILDYGCGYGAIIDYLNNNYDNYSFSGYDISSEMINKAQKVFKGSNICWLTEINKNMKFNYVLSSGLFNVKLNYDNDKWYKYILKTLDKINEHSIDGFSFNMLTNKCDSEYKRNDLYYADQEQIQLFCERNYSENIMVLDNYGLYEFTILVKK